MKTNLGIILTALLMSAASVSELDAQVRNQRQSPAARMAQMMKTMPIVMALDANGDGEISAAEIKKSVAALKALDKNGDGILQSNEMLLQGGNRSPQSQRGRQSSDKALKVGDVAPTFKLKSLDGESETDLADFKGKKPVVLFFGSYT